MKLKHWLIAVSAAGTLAAAPVMAEMGAGAGAGGQDYPGAQEQPGGMGGMGGQDQMGAESPMGQDGMMGQDQQAGTDQEIVRSVQEKLSEQGHDVGPVDGIEGPQTAQALEQFQQSEGLQASGQIDEETLRALGLEDEAAEFAAAEEQPNGAGAQPEPGIGAPGAAEESPGAQPEGGVGGGGQL